MSELNYNIVIFLLVVLLFVMCFIIFLINMRSIQNNTYDMPIKNPSNKPYLFSYWENRNGSRPPYIDLCFKTFYKQCSNNFQVIILDEKSVLNYLPNLRTDLDKLGLAHKSDYIRIALLFYYGGLWLDADTLVLNNLQEIVDKLNQGVDFLGFGCSYDGCKTNGYPKPSNGVMASQQYGILIKQCLNKLDRKITNYFDDSNPKKELGYFDFGKIVIWEELDILMKNGYSYHHFPAHVDGTRDINGNWIPKELIIEKQIQLLDEDKLFFVMLVNSTYCGSDPKYNWFCKKTEQEILEGDYHLARLFKRALA